MSAQSAYPTGPAELPSAYPTSNPPPPPRFTSTSTLALHADLDQPPAVGEVMPGISVTSTYTADGDATGYVYSRAPMSHPIRRRAEAIIGELDGGHCVLYSSGQSATVAALMHFAPRRVALRGGYHGTHQVVDLLGRIASRYGGKVEAVDLDSGLLGEGDVLWLETPNNPACEIHDVAAHCARAHAVGAKVVVDSTFAPPPLQFCLRLGADMVMHSATKYLAGHSDALAGALVTRDSGVYQQLLDDRMVLGSIPGNLEVWLLLRSLRTLEIRVKRQCETAAGLARWLSGPHAAQLGVTKVWHPSLPTHPNHAVASKQMPGGYGGVLSIEVKGDGVAKRLPECLKLFRNATSLGGVESLIEWRHRWDPKVTPRLVRLSVGLEAEADLRADIERALLRAAQHGAKL
eukprot:TRINITY_DN12586_c0_g1_i1.p2 TRINITY_DN12586_c0_g1~~TRINITY_DN12586_c0_g1_i1.p2  ORF type:complete len:404 (+),score=143.32 TRINITY_DN12586_c0_g1_i1:65-1276(+)